MGIKYFVSILFHRFNNSSAFIWNQKQLVLAEYYILVEKLKIYKLLIVQ